MTALSSSVMKALDLLSTLFVFAFGCGVLFTMVVFMLDRRQSRDAVLRNYPVIGHMRYILANLGEFFRQYFFAMDREELPFNRAERSWIERASKNSDSTVAFGSTKSIKEPGTPIFVNCPYPTLDADIERTPHLLIGPDSPNPYAAKSFFNKERGRQKRRRKQVRRAFGRHRQTERQPQERKIGAQREIHQAYQPQSGETIVLRPRCL